MLLRPGLYTSTTRHSTLTTLRVSFGRVGTNALTADTRGVEGDEGVISSARRFFPVRVGEEGTSSAPSGSGAEVVSMIG